MSSTKFIGFDYSHNNKLIIEDTTFSVFIEYLFNSDFKLGKIEAGLTLEKLSKYDIFIIGVPVNSQIEFEEIKSLTRYVSEGGSLLIVNDQGGDYENGNNLSRLCKLFGITFNSDKLFDNEQYSKETFRPIIKNFKKHFITNDILQIIHASGCTLEIDKSIEKEDIDVSSIAFSSKESSWHNYFNGNDWIEEPSPGFSIIGVSHFGRGKIVALGNLALFSSLDDSYGIYAVDNLKLISNIISWLMNKAISEEAKSTQSIFITVPIEQKSYYWIRDKIREGRWKNIEEFINFASKFTKSKMNKEGKPKKA